MILLNNYRCRELVERSVKAFRLKLNSYTVLTEAATGYYMFTPMIAALAGAKKVYLLAATSRFGKAQEVKRAVMRLADSWGIKNRISILTSRKDIRIQEADIVTNLGFVRPLDKSFLSGLKKGAVIPLMCETWEYRPDDLDVDTCHKFNIPVLGTNEQHHNVRTFVYLGYMAAKMLLELGLEVFLSQVVVLGDNRFGYSIRDTLNSLGAQVIYLSTNEKKIPLKGKMILQKADALIIADHTSGKMLVGPGGLIGAKELHAINHDLVVAHICGGIDELAMRSEGLQVFPKIIAAPGRMSVTTDYIGPKPLIDLHTAGLKVAEEMARAKLRLRDAFEAEMAVLKKTNLAQGFPGRHYGQKVKGK